MKKKILVTIFSVFMMVAGFQPVYAESTITMNRLYNPNSGEHFYTSDVNEKNYLVSIGWNDEGVGWYAPSSSNYPVYRLYNRYGGEHHYTLNASERDNLIRVGWTYEGVGWYSAEPNSPYSIALLREYNPNAYACNHNYTTDINEHSYLTKIGWKDEGVGWYGINPNGEATYTPTYYLQQDSKWANVTYINNDGGRNTIGSNGCGPTAIAMVVNGYLKNGTNPKDVADYLYYNTSDFCTVKHGISGRGIRLGLQHYGLKVNHIGSYNDLVNQLSEGKMVIIQVRTGHLLDFIGTHSIVLFSKNGGDTYVYDPGGRHTGWYSISTIWNERTTDSYDLNEGYAGYAASK